MLIDSNTNCTFQNYLKLKCQVSKALLLRNEFPKMISQKSKRKKKHSKIKNNKITVNPPKSFGFHVKCSSVQS